MITILSNDTMSTQIEIPSLKVWVAEELTIANIEYYRIYNNSLYKLNTSVPFTTADIDTEIAEGKWSLIVKGTDLSFSQDIKDYFEMKFAAIAQGAGTPFDTLPDAMVSPLADGQPFFTSEGQYFYDSTKLEGYVLHHTFTENAEDGENLEGSSKNHDGNQTFNQFKAELIEATPTSGSTRAAQSGGVADALEEQKTLLQNEIDLVDDKTNLNQASVENVESEILIVSDKNQNLQSNGLPNQAFIDFVNASANENFKGNIGTSSTPTGTEIEGDYYGVLQDGTYTDFGNIISETGDKIKKTSTGWGIEKRVKVSTDLKIYVDTNGNDLNDGLTPDTPIRSITKLKSIYQDGCTVLFSRNQTWKNKVIDDNGTLKIDSSDLLLEDEMNGNAAYFDLDGSFSIRDNYNTKGYQPKFDASVTIPNASFVLNSGDINTYKFLIETRSRNPYAKVSSIEDRQYLFEDGERLEYKKTVAEVEASVGTFTYVKITDADISTNTWGTVEVYVHPYNSTNPISDAKYYDFTLYSLLINHLPNVTKFSELKNLTLLRACGKDGNHFQEGGIAENIIFKQFSSHTHLKNGSLMENCISVDNIGDCYHAYDGSVDEAGVTYRNCTAVGSEIFDSYYSDIDGTVAVRPIAFYSHGSGAAQQSMISLIDCKTDLTQGIQLTDTKIVNALRLIQKNYTMFSFSNFYENYIDYKELNLVDSKGFLSPDFDIDESVVKISFRGAGNLNLLNFAIIGGYWRFSDASSETNMNCENVTCVKLYDGDDFDLYNHSAFGQASFKNSIFYLADNSFNNSSSGTVPRVIRNESNAMEIPIFENCYLHNQWIDFLGTFYTAEEFKIAYPSNVIGELKSNLIQRTDFVLGQTVYKDYKGLDGATDRVPDSGTGISENGNSYTWEYDGRNMIYVFDIGIDMFNSMIPTISNHPTILWVNTDDNKRYSMEDKYNGQYISVENGITYNNGYGLAIVDDTTGIATGDGTTSATIKFTNDGKLYVKFDLYNQQVLLPNTPIDLKINFLEDIIETNVFIGNPRLGNFDINPKSEPGKLGIGYNERDVSRSNRIEGNSL